MNAVVACVKGWVEKEEASVALACKLSLWFKRHIPSQFLPMPTLVGMGKVHKACPAPPALLASLLAKLFHIEREEQFLSPAASHGYAA